MEIFERFMNRPGWSFHFNFEEMKIDPNSCLDQGCLSLVDIYAARRLKTSYRERVTCDFEGRVSYLPLAFAARVDDKTSKLIDKEWPIKSRNLWDVIEWIADHPPVNDFLVCKYQLIHFHMAIHLKKDPQDVVDLLPPWATKRSQLDVWTMPDRPLEGWKPTPIDDYLKQHGYFY
mgnify:CR=1 FL=1